MTGYCDYSWVLIIFIVHLYNIYLDVKSQNDGVLGFVFKHSAGTHYVTSNNRTNSNLNKPINIINQSINKPIYKSINQETIQPIQGFKLSWIFSLDLTQLPIKKNWDLNPWRKEESILTCYKHLRLSMILMMLGVKHGLTKSGQENID